MWMLIKYLVFLTEVSFCVTYSDWFINLIFMLEKYIALCCGYSSMFLPLFSDFSRVDLVESKWNEGLEQKKVLKSGEKVDKSLLLTKCQLIENSVDKSKPNSRSISPWIIIHDESIGNWFNISRTNLSHFGNLIYLKMNRFLFLFRNACFLSLTHNLNPFLSSYYLSNKLIK